MGEQGRSYVAYMVRFWREQSGRQLVWRASLEDPHTGERKGFANVESLLAFLREQTNTRADRFTAIWGEKDDNG